MSRGLERTPVDELTRLPLPVLMKGTDFASLTGRETRRTPNYHHHFHPKVSPELGYDEDGSKLPEGDPLRLEGRAVRYSRGQYMPKWLHERYHRIFEGPELPMDTQSKFTAVVLACAGVVPRQALDLYSPGEYTIVTLGHKDYEFIRRKLYYEGASNNTKLHDRKSEIGMFIATYAINNGLNNLLSAAEVRQKVDEFMSPINERSRRAAGHFLLEQAVDASVADLVPIHQEAKEEGMAKKSTKRLGDLMLRYFAPYRFQDYFVPLEDRLSASHW